VGSDVCAVQLCNVFFTRELQKRLSSSSSTKGITANCFNPGLIVSTGLFRDQNKVFTKVFDFAATDLLKVGETPEWGGEALAYMTTVDTKGLYYSSAPGSSKYGAAAFGNQFHPSEVSKEAQDDAKGKRLWELTEKILGIS
jgi:protochlorophyllide reductase